MVSQERKAAIIIKNNQTLRKNILASKVKADCCLCFYYITGQQRVRFKEGWDSGEMSVGVSFSIKVYRQNTSPSAGHCWTPSLVSIYLPHLSFSISSTPSAVEYDPLHFVHCLQLGCQYITSHKSLRSTRSILLHWMIDYGLQNMRPPTVSQALVTIMADNGKS